MWNFVLTVGEIGLVSPRVATLPVESDTPGLLDDRSAVPAYCSACRHSRAADALSVILDSLAKPKSRRTNASSILRHSWIYLIRPGQDSARKVLHLAESCLTQEVDGLAAADAGTAVRNDLAT